MMCLREGEEERRERASAASGSRSGCAECALNGCIGLKAGYSRYRFKIKDFVKGHEWY
jgi:hypothetical protein